MFSFAAAVLAPAAAEAQAARAVTALPLDPYQYFAPPVSSMMDAGEAQNTRARSPGQQRIVSLYEAGEYARAGDEGLKLMAQERLDDGVLLLVGNSLAWSSRLDEAVRTYQAISDPTVTPDANVGIANVLRWQNREHLSVPIYQRVLKEQPQHTEARNGLLLAQRELAPRTTVTYGGMNDSNQFHRDGMTVNHRWRTNDGYGKFEVEFNAVHDTMPDASGNGSTVDVSQQDATLRYQALDLEYKPTFELGAPTGQGGKAPFGGLKLQLMQDHVQVDVGQVNWGRISTNANALNQGLTASHLGVSTRGVSVLGEVTAQMNYYGVSDGNEVWYGGARLLSNWQPLGSHIKLYTGLDFRQTDFFTPSYWSPSTGYGFLYAGLQANWEEDDWNIYAQGHWGMGVYGEAGDGWSAAAGARRWLTRDVAVSFNLWAVSTRRSGNEYSAQTLGLVLEKVWR